MTESEPNPAYYIFVTSNLSTFDREIPAREIIKVLLGGGYWFLGSRTRNRKRVKAGDKALFYAAGLSNSVFLATATITSTCKPVTVQEKRVLDKELVEELSFEHSGLLSFEVADVLFFENPVSAKLLISQLTFIKNHKRWGGYFQGGSVNIPKEDFELIHSAGLRSANSI